MYRRQNKDAKLMFTAVEAVYRRVSRIANMFFAARPTFAASRANE